MDITHDPITLAAVKAIPAGVVAVERRQLFTASGTWTRPAAMVGNPTITMIGGGASGSVDGNKVGGDGGQYVIDLLVDVGATTSVSVTIGNGGAVATSISRNAGSPSSFGAFLTVLGASGGSSYTGNACAGAPGGNQTSTALLAGSSTPLGSGGQAASGGAGGGGLELGSAPQRGGVTAPNDKPARGYGAGGAAAASGTSGAGAPGACLVKWWETV